MEPRMSDVYLIQNRIDGKQYVGIAQQQKLDGSRHGFQNRWKSHKKIAQLPADQKHYVLHRAMAKHGIDNFSIQKILSVPEDDAGGYETMMIEMYDCQVPKGYNITSGGEGCSRPMQTYLREKAYAKQWASKDLPMNIRYARNGDSVGFMVKKVGYGDSRSFTSAKYTTEENLQMAKDYLTERKPKSHRELPRHIMHSGDGLIVQVRRNCKIVVSKWFGKGTFEDRLEQAKAYVAHIYESGMV